MLRAVVSDYLKRTGIELTPHLEIDNFAMAISLVASTRGVALLPASAENFLTWSVVSRPLKGETPTIDLVVGYHKANKSPILRTFLSKIDDLTTRISSKARRINSAVAAMSGVQNGAARTAFSGSKSLVAKRIGHTCPFGVKLGLAAPSPTCLLYPR